MGGSGTPPGTAPWVPIVPHISAWDVHEARIAQRRRAGRVHFSGSELTHIIAAFGYGAVLLFVFIESMGIPFPGETALIGGAVYAGTGGHLSIVGVIAAAAAGAILGDNLGYTVGRHRGYQLVRALAPKLHLNERHLTLAEGFFQRHGDKTVFLGRFFAILRCWAAFLAGVNRMQWRTFLCWNAMGGVLWAIIYGTLGYVLGNNLPLLERILRIMGWGGTLSLAALLVALLICWQLWRRGVIRATWLDAAWERLGGWLVHPAHPAHPMHPGAGDVGTTASHDDPSACAAAVLFEEPESPEVEATAEPGAEVDVPQS